VVVKFTQRYSGEVHRVWAEAGYAPELLRHALLPGGWHMLVMESLEPGDGWCMLQEVPDDMKAAAGAAATAALQAVHLLPIAVGRSGKQVKGVHGDMRAGANVLFRRAANAASGWEVQFIDFENAGPENKAVYPPFMSSSIQWPPGVRHGAKLQQEHDKQLLRSTLSLADASTGGTGVLAQGVGQRHRHVSAAPPPPSPSPAPNARRGDESGAVGRAPGGGAARGRGRRRDLSRGQATQALPHLPARPHGMRLSGARAPQLCLFGGCLA